MDMEILQIMMDTEDRGSYNLCRGPEASSHIETDKVISQNSKVCGNRLCPVPHFFLERGIYQDWAHLEI